MSNEGVGLKLLEEEILAEERLVDEDKQARDERLISYGISREIIEVNERATAVMGDIHPQLEGPLEETLHGMMLLALGKHIKFFKKWFEMVNKTRERVNADTLSARSDFLAHEDCRIITEMERKAREMAGFDEARRKAEEEKILF